MPHRFQGHDVLDGKSPLGSSRKGSEEGIVENVVSRIDNVANLSDMEKKQARECSRSVRTYFLLTIPEERSFVSPGFLGSVAKRDYYVWYTTHKHSVTADTSISSLSLAPCRKDLNTVSQLKVSADANAAYRRQRYLYWSFFDLPMLRQLQQDHWDSLKRDRSWRSSGDVLFGMGIGCSMQLSSFRSHALDCFVAACEADPPSLLGQGVVTKIANAFQPGWVVQNSHTINGREVIETME